MKPFLLSLLLVLSFACKRKLDKNETERQIRKAMHAFLMKGKDSTQIKFDIKNVEYFEDSSFYDCRFVVEMQFKGKDTTGYMRAKVYKDFETVKRRE